MLKNWKMFWVFKDYPGIFLWNKIIIVHLYFLLFIFFTIMENFKEIVL